MTNDKLAREVDHIPAPAEHAPLKDYVEDPLHGEANVFELENGEDGAWITMDIDSLMEVRR